MLLTDLANTLVDYAADVDKKAAIKAVGTNLMAEARKKTDCMPIIHTVDGMLSNFAMELLRAQAAKVSSFDICEEVPSYPGLYIIARSRALTTQTTSHDIPDDTQHGIDFGLQVPSFSRPRYTNLNSCSCQFNTC
jgi:hypothetical protein